jgi:nucleoside-diphosphate-sugar epimerase
MKVLVTGAAGRLGSRLVELYSENDCDVRAFDLPFVNWEHIENIAGVEPFPGDITDPCVVSQACVDLDVIVHLAAILPPHSESIRDTTLRVNVEGTRNLLENIETNTAVIQASSISVYGITYSESTPIREDHLLQNHNNYSESKIEAERLIEASGVSYVILRVAPIAVADLLELPDVVPYRADQRVEFINVEDAAHAFYQASLIIEARGKTLNVAGGISWQMTGSEYLEAFYGALGIDVEPNYSEIFTAVDWYDTSEGEFLGYQRTSFYDFKGKLNSVAEELGLI